MKRWIPDGRELAVLGGLALAGAVVVVLIESTDVAMSLGSIPIFLVAAMMGMRRRFPVK